MKKLVSLILAVLLLFALLPGAVADAEPETWAVYLYLCGSNLESNDGHATKNIEQLFESSLPENVTFVIETGGSTAWHNNYVSNDALDRWTFRTQDGKNSFTCVQSLPNAPMSSPDTFEDFLSFAHTNYPADHTMLIVWDHGCGTIRGACKDENFPDVGYMPVSGMATACRNVFGTNTEEPPLDIIAFDCCLMGTVDIGFAFSGCARYMLASEEVIPGDGWNYTALLNTFRNDPNIDPETLGISICNDYLAYYEKENNSGTVTLSLVDLNKIEPVVIACENLGLVLLASLYEDNTIYQDFAINALQAENFGGNSRAQGFTNLVDLYDFAACYAKDGLEQAMAVCEAVEDCVICRVCGPYRKFSHGLSFYFPYDGNLDELKTLDKEGAVLAFDAFYSIATGRPLSEQIKNFIAQYTELDPENPPVIPSFENVDTSHTEVFLNEDGRVCVNFGQEVGSATVQAMVNLYLISESGSIYMLGNDDEITCDFENAFFINKFGGKWLAINDEWIAYMNLDYDGDEYHIYSIPIIYDDHFCWMQRGYNFSTGAWENLGIRAASADPGSSRSYFPKEGEPFRLMQRIRDDENGGYKYIGVADLTFSDHMYSYVDLPDGRYAMEFRLDDVFRNTLFSKPWYFSIRNGQIIYD